MSTPIIPLESLQIARPCRADWNQMTGDERARFCGSCEKNVYDISQMTRAQAHDLIAQREDHVCVRLYRRPDGTVITSDCPVGKREATRPMWWTLAGFVALMASGAAVWSQPRAEQPTSPHNATPLVDKAREWPVVGAIVEKVAPRPPMIMGAIAFAPAAMGKVAMPPAPNAPVSSTPVSPTPVDEPAVEMGEIGPVCPAPVPTQ